MRACVVVFFLGCGLLQAGDLEWESKIIEKDAPRGAKKVEATFAFKNVSEVPVEIRSVKTSCGCTTAGLEKKVYQPAETGEVQATFTIGGRKGRQEKAIIVQTGTEKHVLVLRAFLADAIGLDKEALTWKVGGATETQSIGVSVLDKEGVVKEVRSSSADFEAKLVEMEPGKSYRVDVRPKSTDRALQKVVRLEIADPDPRTIFLRVNIEP